MRCTVSVFNILIILMLSLPLHAKLKTAVLRLCFEKEGKSFTMSTRNEETAALNNFIAHKDSGRFLRKIKMFLDNEQHLAFKPYTENCLTVYKIPRGYHTISVDFKGASYTNLKAENEITKNYKADLLYKAKIQVIEGPSATLKIYQDQNKVTAFQSVDNKPIQNCTKECIIPTEIPIYFKTKGEGDKVPCPTSYTLYVKNEYEKKMNCYSKERIKRKLNKHVKKNNILCKVNIEYAHFNVYGDGCIVSLEADEMGLNPKMPKIKLLPLEKQKIKYYLQINDEKKELYKFSGDKKGKEITPRNRDIIIFTEVREL